MHPGKLITLSIWLLILFNLVLAFGSVWSFQRMNPAISRIYERNVKSLDACEDMMLILTDEEVDIDRFNAAFQVARSNITEKGEEQAIRNIQELVDELKAEHKDARRLITREIITLNECNKNAIKNAAEETQNMRQAGAWGIVFLTVLFFLIAIYFEQRLRRTLLMPLQEISDVMRANMQGDKFRRCNLLHASDEMKKLFEAVNSLLDRR